MFLLSTIAQASITLWLLVSMPIANKSVSLNLLVRKVLFAITILRKCRNVDQDVGGHTKTRSNLLVNTYNSQHNSMKTSRTYLFDS